MGDNIQTKVYVILLVDQHSAKEVDDCRTGCLGKLADTAITASIATHRARVID